MRCGTASRVRPGHNSTNRNYRLREELQVDCLKWKAEGESRTYTSQERANQMSPPIVNPFQHWIHSQL